MCQSSAPRGSVLAGDHLWSALRGVCLCLYWFDPLVWIMLRAAEGDMERSCDSDVVKGLAPEERARYGQVILDAARTSAHTVKGASS